MARVAKSFRVEPEAQKKPSVKKKITKNKAHQRLNVPILWLIITLQNVRSLIARYIKNKLLDELNKKETRNIYYKRLL